MRTDRTSPAEQARLRGSVGELLRNRRIGRGFPTQGGLAAAAGYSRQFVSMVENGAWRLSETSTRRLAEVLRAGEPPVEIARLDLELQRAAGSSLRRWRGPLSARWQRVYDEAARRLDEPCSLNPEMGRLLAALSPRERSSV